MHHEYIGIANFPLDGADTQQLINYADKALFRAKNNGRNQVVVYSEIDKAE